jgi:hypothetical protein
MLGTKLSDTFPQLLQVFFWHIRLSVMFLQISGIAAKKHTSLLLPSLQELFDYDWDMKPSEAEASTTYII